MSREDEKAWEAVQAAFKVTDEIMAERGWKEPDITREYLRRAVERLWIDDDGREAFRVKVQAAVSMAVDDLFDSIGDVSSTTEQA